MWVHKGFVVSGSQLRILVWAVGLHHTSKLSELSENKRRAKRAAGSSESKPMNFFASKPVTLACQGARGQYSFPALYYIPKAEMSSKRTAVVVRLLFGFHVMLVDCCVSM